MTDKFLRDDFCDIDKILNNVPFGSDDDHNLGSIK